MVIGADPTGVRIARIYHQGWTTGQAPMPPLNDFWVAVLGADAFETTLHN